MEDRPHGGAPTIYCNHGEESSPNQSNISVNNDQRHCQLQGEETQTKKIENGKINGTTAEEEETPTSFNQVSSLHPMSSNGGTHPIEINLKQKPPRKAFIANSPGEKKGNNNSTSSMDCKNDKPSDLKILEGKRETLASLNGVVTVNSGQLANGYPNVPCGDNDGSGSESGYTTPKKRRAQRNGKAGDSVIAAQVKTMHQIPVAPDSPSKPQGSQPDGGRVPSKAESHSGGPKVRQMPTAVTAAPHTPPAAEPQRKNSDSGKAAGAAGKKFEDRSGKVKVVTSVSVKEDSWTLFKPPPVFPVDNSSAKIVPKISYASKVKENLNKAAQTVGDALPPPPPITTPSQVPGRLSQVPMSAVKTITSASFSNGPLSGEGNSCPLPGPLFNSTPSGAATALVPTGPGDENVASSSSTTSGSTSVSSATTMTVVEPRKPSLFVSAFAPSNMQLSLPSARQPDPPNAQTNQKSLGDIFQNQWGLSFINEPSAGPETTVCRSLGKGKPVEVTFQGDCSSAIVGVTQTPSASPLRSEHPPFPKAYELDKRTSVQTLNRGATSCPPSGAAAQDSPSQTPVFGLDAQKDEAGGHGAIVFCSSSKDPGAELPQTCPVPAVLALVRDQGRTKGFDRRSDSGSFDLKAAVIYHTKEMEYILNLQKQDPNRVVLYCDLKDGPDH
ncbi:nuclear fragile X mental retardation-interacting protein 2 [Chanos chanos]|uniref:Nuclear fragile X mental retardation-interacting protein 2 n=1 Tax=Chanos chanos TaxID=29144 RepID=A0A6J2VMC0_CHACN|nr:nuclear fragile X mental retardation-interacting protein 2-like [Chanos chanos]